MNQKNYLSQEKYNELTAELENLKMNRRRAVAERLEFAKSLGDLTENAEFHAAREEQAEIEDRISQLELALKNAEVITAHHSSTVEVGSTLIVERVDNGSQNRFTIVGSEEADAAAGKISSQSPLGAGLLGHKKGETIEIKTPRGEVHYKIISLE